MVTKVQRWIRAAFARRKRFQQAAQVFEKVMHPVENRYYYHNLRSHVCTWVKPKILGFGDLPPVPWLTSKAFGLSCFPKGAHSFIVEGALLQPRCYCRTRPINGAPKPHELHVRARKGLALPQSWNAGDVSPSGRSRRSDPCAAAPGF